MGQNLASNPFLHGFYQSLKPGFLVHDLSLMHIALSSIHNNAHNVVDQSQLHFSFFCQI